MSRQRGIAGRAAVVERAFFFAVLAAALPTILLVAMNGLAPVGASATFPLRLWGWAAIACVALLAPVPIAIAAIARSRALQWLPRAVLAAEAAWILFAVLFLNRVELSSLAALEGPARFRWLVPAAFGSDLGMADLRGRYLEHLSLESWTCFENRQNLLVFQTATPDRSRRPP